MGPANPDLGGLKALGPVSNCPTIAVLGVRPATRAAVRGLPRTGGP